MASESKLDFIINLIDKASAPTDKISQSIVKAQRLASCGFNTMRDGATGLAAAGLGLYKMVAPAEDFRKSLGEIASLGAPQKEINALAEAAKNFASEFGGVPAEIVRAGYDIQSAIGGLDNGDLAKFTSRSALLAKATKSDTGTITGYVATMHGVFNRYAKEIGNAQFIDELTGKTAKAVEIFRTTGPEMQTAFANLGGIGDSHGIGMDEQMSVVGMLQQVTGSGSVAATQYKAFLSGVMKAQDALGMKFTDTAGKMIPMADILNMIKERAGGDLNSGDLFALEKAFGSKEASAAISNMIKQTDKLGENINTLSGIKGVDNAVKMIFGGIMSAIMAGTKILKLFQYYTFVVQYYTQIWGIKTKIMSVFQVAWNGICAASVAVMNLLKSSTHYTAIKFVFMKTVSLIAVAAMWVMNGGLIGAAAGAWAFAAASWATGIPEIILLIVALGAAIFALVYYWDDIVNALIYAWGKISEFFVWLWEGTKRICSAVGEWFGGLWDSILSGVKKLWGTIGGIWDKITDFFGGGKTEATLNENIAVDNPALSADRIRPDFSNVKSVSNSINKTNNFGDVNIRVNNGFTPAQIAEWQALQA